MSILVIAEHDNQQLKPASLHTLSAAQQLKASITVIIAGHHCHAAATQAAHYAHVSRVIQLEMTATDWRLAESLTQAILPHVVGHEFILAPASNFGKNLLPRLAALLDVEQISDVTEIIAPDTFVRPIYAGNAYTTVQSLDAIKCLTIRSTAFALATSGNTPAPIQTHAVPTASTANSRFIEQQLIHSTRPELTTARVIVAGGRGLQSSENFQLLEALADKLNAAVAASRAAVDAGFAANDYQVGQTGKVVAPELYIAVGISGAAQHIAGMKESKVIVAINKDPDAPIFQIADYGLVGDLFILVPELTALLA